MTRRSLCALALLAPYKAQARQLSPNDLPAEFAKPLSIDEAWFTQQSKRQHERIDQGSAEHIAYYLLQSSSFTTEPPIQPILATHKQLKFPEKRAADFLATKPATDRHRLIKDLYNQLNWPLERCYQHTREFLSAKEIDQAPLEPLYQQRGLSSDTSPESLTALTTFNLSAKRVLLAGPGLDLTRRESFDDNLPLVSHQLNYLRDKYPHVDTIDIRPEVIAHLHATPHDLTTQILASQYDLIIATNLFVYLNDAELLCAIAGLSLSLPPGASLVHNDTRFAAKVFGEAVHLPAKDYKPVHLSGNKWDRLVIHQKTKQ